MSRLCASAARGLALAACLSNPMSAWGAQPGDIVAVEEDWELTVGEPDGDRVAPQVTCVTTAAGSLHGWYVALELNHQTLPEFGEGGLHLQLYNGGECVEFNSSAAAGSLAHAGETVRWTQRLRVEGDNLVVETVDGQSESWSAFGNESGLRATVAAGLANLNAYNPAASVAHSGVGYAANRVQSLVLKRVHYRRANGEVVTDETVRTVYPRP